MNFTNSWVNNNGVKIHFAEVNSDLKNRIPLVIIPGLSESAEDYLAIVEKFSPRHCVIITLRGRGKSDSPTMGYRLEDHISDIDAVINHLHLEDFILMGYSRGVSYAIGYAIQNASLLKGLIIGDYPAVHTHLPEGWVEFFSSLPPWRGKPLDERMKIEALHALQKESVQVSFWEDLSSIKCPVLIIRGGKEGAILSQQVEMQYVEKIPHANIVVFEESDHNIFEHIETFIQTTELFMEKIK